LLDTILLLAGPSEQPVLMATFKGHDPRLTVVPITSPGELLSIEPGVLGRARLVAFASPVIVPAEILDQLGFGAYNFHPGPPNFPGLAPAQFAVYHGATTFGATAHVMVEKVDAGPIIGVELFPIIPAISVIELEWLTYRHMAHIFWQLAKSLATQVEPLPHLPIRWSGEKSTRRRYAAMCNLAPDISKDELHRRIRAFGGNSFGLGLTLNLHGTQFALTTPAPPLAPKLASNAIAPDHNASAPG
jgi:methionyl-tRNA formyltransferase